MKRSYPDHITALIILNHNMACTVTVELQVKQISTLISRLPRNPLQTQILENKQTASHPSSPEPQNVHLCLALPRRDVIHSECSGRLGWKRAEGLHARNKHEQVHAVHMSMTMKTQNRKGCDGILKREEQEDVKRMWLEFIRSTWMSWEGNNGWGWSERWGKWGTLGHINVTLLQWFFSQALWL